MRKAIALFSTLFLLGACAGAPMQQAKYEATCRTHARTVSYTGSPDENIPYLECMHIKGMHEVVVEEIK